MNPEPRILIIDDEAQIRRFLRISLVSQGYAVHEAEDAATGLADCATWAPDVVVLDLGLPDRDGQEVLKDLRQWSSVPVIILSVRQDEDEKVAALDAGANDYVTKPFGIREFLARLRGLLRGAVGEQTDNGHYRDEQLGIDLGARRVVVHGEPVRLTRKEFAVLQRLVVHPDRVITQTALLKDIWGPTHVGDTHYLRIIVARLRQKLGDDPADPGYIITEPGVGYRFVPRK